MRAGQRGQSVREPEPAQVGQRLVRGGHAVELFAQAPEPVAVHRRDQALFVTEQCVDRHRRDSDRRGEFAQRQRRRPLLGQDPGALVDEALVELTARIRIGVDTRHASNYDQVL